MSMPIVEICIGILLSLDHHHIVVRTGADHPIRSRNVPTFWHRSAFWPQLMNPPIARRRRPSPEDATTLRKSHGVSQLVGAVVGARSVVIQGTNPWTESDQAQAGSAAGRQFTFRIDLDGGAHHEDAPVARQEPSKYGEDGHGTVALHNCVTDQRGRANGQA